jgi:hypothetical protein
MKLLNNVLFAPLLALAISFVFSLCLLYRIIDNQAYEIQGWKTKNFVFVDEGRCSYVYDIKKLAVRDVKCVNEQ